MIPRYDLIAVSFALLCLLVIPPFLEFIDDVFLMDVVRRIMILALAVLTLDFILGHGGMVSLGHAVYLGVGGYTVGILSTYGIDSGFIQIPASIAVCAVLALVIGSLSLRTTGIYFIMITLAFSQMVFYLATSLEGFGGDDGMSLGTRMELPGLDLYDDWTFYYFVLAILTLAILLFKRLVESPFGVMLKGISQNERRMRAIGINTRTYKLIAFVISGAVCGLAGALLATQTEFFSPDYMHWSRSGDLLVMGVLGGLATLSGPLIGAAAFVFLEVFLSDITEHWHLIFGPFLLILAVASRGGILEFFADVWGRVRHRHVRSEMAKDRRVAE